MGVRWVINTWDGLCRAQVMEIACYFCKFSTCSLFLSFLFFKYTDFLVFFKLFPYFFVLYYQLVTVSIELLPFIKRDVDNFFLHKNHAHTFYCNIHGNYLVEG